MNNSNTIRSHSYSVTPHLFCQRMATTIIPPAFSLAPTPTQLSNTTQGATPVAPLASGDDDSQLLQDNENDDNNTNNNNNNNGDENNNNDEVPELDEIHPLLVYESFSSSAESSGSRPVRLWSSIDAAKAAASSPFGAHTARVFRSDNNINIHTNNNNSNSNNCIETPISRERPQQQQQLLRTEEEETQKRTKQQEQFEEYIRTPRGTLRPPGVSSVPAGTVKKLVRVPLRLLHFYQNYVSNSFMDGRGLSETIQQLRAGTATPETIPPLEAMYCAEGVWYGMGNRRLSCYHYVYRKCPDYPIPVVATYVEANTLLPQGNGRRVRIGGGLVLDGVSVFTMYHATEPILN